MSESGFFGKELEVDLKENDFWDDITWQLSLWKKMYKKNP